MLIKKLRKIFRTEELPLYSNIRPIQTRKGAEKAFVRAVKVGIKAENHFYNANKLQVEPSKDEFKFQIEKAKRRNDDCLSILGLINSYFEKNQELITGKSKFLNEMIGNLLNEMKQLEIKIKALCQNSAKT